MKLLRYYIAWLILWIGIGFSLAGSTVLDSGKLIRKLAMRFGGVDEEEAHRERKEEVDRRIAERRAAPADKYSIDLTTWKGDDGSPVVELLEMSREQFSALCYTASVKHVTVESLLGDAVRKAVAV